MMVLYAVVLPVILLFCGLSLDVGLMQLRKEQMQSAADAAALGAQISLERGDPLWFAAGISDAALNGFTNGANSTTVAIQQQPATGAYANGYDAIQVVITQSVKTYFMGALHGGSSTVSARSIALLSPCGYFSGAAGFSVTSPFALNLNTYSSMNTRCPVYSGTDALVDFGSQLIANGINVNQPAAQSIIAGYTPKAPRFGAKAMADPLASIPAPSVGGCDYLGVTVVSITTTLNPGTYCLGMTITGANVTLRPGLYIIEGGAAWTFSNITGSGVTLYFTNSPLGYGQFTINLSTVLLSAPTDDSNGGIPTLLVFGDRNWVKTTSTDFRVLSSYFVGDGVWYTSGSGISVFASTFAGINYFALDTDNLQVVSSTVNPLGNFSFIPTGNPFRPASGLVE